MIQRRRGVRVEEPELVAVDEPAVGIHSIELDLVLVAIRCDGIKLWEDGQTISASEERQVVAEYATGKVGRRYKA